MALDHRPPSRHHTRARAAIPRSQARFLRALEQLPPARQGPKLRPGRVAFVRPVPRPRPRAARPRHAGELQPRLILTMMVAAAIVGSLVAVLG